MIWEKERILSRLDSEWKEEKKKMKPFRKSLQDSGEKFSQSSGDPNINIVSRRMNRGSKEIPFSFIPGHPHHIRSWHHQRAIAREDSFSSWVSAPDSEAKNSDWLILTDSANDNPFLLFLSSHHGSILFSVQNSEKATHSFLWWHHMSECPLGILWTASHKTGPRHIFIGRRKRCQSAKDDHHVMSWSRVDDAVWRGNQKPWHTSWPDDYSIQIHEMTRDDEVRSEWRVSRGFEVSTSVSIIIIIIIHIPWFQFHKNQQD